MKNILLIFLGGGLGSVLRYGTVVGMARDLVDCPGATLVPPSDVAALAAALAELGEANDLATRGEAARRMIEGRFTWPKIAVAYEGLFEEVRTGFRTDSSKSI